MVLGPYRSRTTASLILSAALLAGCVTPTLPGEHHDHAGDAHLHNDEHGTFGPAGFDPRTPPELGHTHVFEKEQGRIPSLEEAKGFAKKYSRFVAQGDKGIEKLRAEGHLKGNGTTESPYILERFFVDGELSLTSLHKAIIVREGYVTGQLRLNYIGDDVYVHHVFAKDLRVNENIKRNGTNTGGRFHDNHFAFVGQIRHFTGEFHHNRVGPKPADVVHEAAGDSGLVTVPAAVVFNLDGFHGADIHDNEFHGQVDVKLHGHNHGDCFTCPAHDHSDLSDAGHEDHRIADNPHGLTSVHQIRYSSLLLRDNTIHVPGGAALRYNDRNHAGDDRTANSEPHERLNDPHVHYQDVTIRGNHLQGGNLIVDVFNAPDDRHVTQNRGILRIWDNKIEAHYAPPDALRRAPALVHGMHLRSLDGLELLVRNNEIRFQEVRSAQPGAELLSVGSKPAELHGIQIDSASDSNLTIEKSLVAQGRFGVFAQSLAETTHWWLRQNQFQTIEPWRGKDVAHPPTEE